MFDRRSENTDMARVSAIRQVMNLHEQQAMPVQREQENETRGKAGDNAPAVKQEPPVSEADKAAVRALGLDPDIMPAADLKAFIAALPAMQQALEQGSESNKTMFYGHAGGYIFDFTRTATGHRVSLHGFGIFLHFDFKTGVNGNRTQNVTFEGYKNASYSYPATGRCTTKTGQGATEKRGRGYRINSYGCKCCDRRKNYFS